MPVALAAIANLLFPGLREVTGKYQQISKQYDKIFDTMKSEMSLERTVEARYLGYAQLKNEGAATQFDNNAGQRFTFNQEHVEIALGYAITRKAIDDNLYKTQFMPSNLGLTAVSGRLNPDAFAKKPPAQIQELLDALAEMTGGVTVEFDAKGQPVAMYYGGAVMISTVVSQALAVAAKAGLLKGLWIAILALKKFIIIGAVAVYAFFKRMFNRSGNNSSS